MRGFRTLVSLSVLCALTSVAGAAQPLALSYDTRQFPGAPITVTQVASYTEQAGGFKFQHIVCVSFRVRERALTSVRFTLTSRDDDWKEYQRMTIERSGTFAAGTIVNGQPSQYGTGPRSCAGMNILRTDAPHVTVRLVAATYDDGTAWTAPEADLPPTVVTAASAATPSPLTGSPPPWNAANHARYLAVLFGREHTTVAIFAPGQTVSSATIPIDGATTVAFDGSGTLFVGTGHEGVAIFAPGATSPTRRLAAANGTALAVDPAGDVATGAADGDSNVHVYPGGSEHGEYVLPAHVGAGGIAFAPTGELAVADTEAPLVKIYGPGATTATRTVAVAPRTRLVAYDAAGHLVVGNPDLHAVTAFAVSTGVKSVEVKGPVLSAMALAPDNLLLYGTPQGVQIFPLGRTVAQLPPMLHGGRADVLAVTPNGVIAAGDSAHGLVVLYADGVQTVIGGLDGVRGLAFSP